MPRRKSVVLSLVLPLLSCLSLGPGAHARQETAPSLLKRTINVTLKRYLRHWKNPAAAEPVSNTRSWVPLVSFAVNGPVPGGSQVYVEFDTPEGKPWLRHNMRTPTLEPDSWEMRHKLSRRRARNTTPKA